MIRLISRWYLRHCVRIKRWCIACLGLAAWLAVEVVAQVPDPSRLKMEEWAANGMTKDPVALAFDAQGRVYLVETARRGSVDIDIRSHRGWLLEDLASDDFESMRAFFRRRMAPELSKANANWLQDRNQDGSHDFHDLTTISERIRLIEDTDGDGVADKSTVYAEGFNEEFTGVAAGILPYDGDVLMTVYPDLWRLRDLDDDGIADGRVSMFRGFGVHAAFDGHDLHGLTIGPEGKIYFSCGDNGFSVVTREGKRLHYPNTGGVLRMDPDGSNLEVYAIGLRNVQEFDFDQYGNMFGVDNDGDLEDERERAVYIAEGSDSGWRLNWQFRSPGWAPHNGGMTYNPWTAEGMWKPQHPEQPAYITPAMQNYSVGPGGFKFNPGTALSQAYRDFFFCVQFPVQKITAFRTRPRGAGFEMVDEHLFHGGLMVSSLNFGPDGGLYLADWIGKWQPNGEGIIYRVDDPERRGSAERQEVRALIRDGVASVTDRHLLDLLGHADRRVRQLAQFELVRRERGDALLEVATKTDAPQLARIHALWGLLQLRDSSSTKTLAQRLPWHDSDPRVVQQCARVAGDLGLRQAVPFLTNLVSESRDALVRSHAAIALGKLADTRALACLTKLLEENDDADPFLRHAAVHGLAGAVTSASLAELQTSNSAAVRLGAVLALRRQGSPEIANFLRDPDVRVAREAVRGVHDDFSILSVLPNVAKLLEESIPIDEPIVRRVLSANLRVGDRDAANRLIQFVLHPPDLGSITLAMQEEALLCLASWEQHPLVDRVEGRIRTSDRKIPAAGRETLTKHLDDLLQLEADTLTTSLAEIARRLKLPLPIERVKSWALDDQRSLQARLAALKLLDHEVEDLLATVTPLLPNDWTNPSRLQEAAFEALVKHAPRQALRQVDLSVGGRGKQFFIRQLGFLKLPAAERLLASELTKLVEDEEKSTMALDIVMAARHHGGDQFKAALGKFEEQTAKHPWGEYQFSLAAGDAERGEALYRGHVQAQCVRCHDAGGEGKQAGPVLKGIAGRVKPLHLLEALIDPSATIAKGYEMTSLLLEDGRVVNGTIIQEDAKQIVVGTTQGKTELIDVSAVEERVRQKQSAMPTMRELLSPAEVRDLVAYLMTLE